MKHVRRAVVEAWRRAAGKKRLSFFQRDRFWCVENSTARNYFVETIVPFAVRWHGLQALQEASSANTCISVVPLALIVDEKPHNVFAFVAGATSKTLGRDQPPHTQRH
jgi:hypothetical protein